MRSRFVVWPIKPLNTSWERRQTCSAFVWLYWPPCISPTEPPIPSLMNSPRWSLYYWPSPRSFLSFPSGQPNPQRPIASRQSPNTFFFFPWQAFYSSFFFLPSNTGTTKRRNQVAAFIPNKSGAKGQQTTILAAGTGKRLNAGSWHVHNFFFRKRHARENALENRILCFRFSLSCFVSADSCFGPFQQ